MKPNFDDARETLAAVGRLKRSKKFAALAREIYKVHTNEFWREAGYSSFEEWGVKTIERKRSRLFEYVGIFKYLPGLSEDQMNRLGVSKCAYLVRLAKKLGIIDADWIQKAEKLDYPRFKRAVERELRKEGTSEEFGERFEPAFRGMAHAPISEQGVVYLFGMVSKELGFIVEAVKSSYPDCIAKQRISQNPERWRQVRIEFEYRSSNFHHPTEGSDLIVCWEDDLAQRGQKPPLPVLELKSAIRDLSPVQKSVQTEAPTPQRKQKRA